MGQFLRQKRHENGQTNISYLDPNDIESGPPAEQDLFKRKIKSGVTQSRLSERFIEYFAFRHQEN